MNAYTAAWGAETGKGRWLSAALVAGVMTLAPAMFSTASAATAFPYLEPGSRSDESGIYRRGEMISEAELDTLRGGFSLAGMEMNFGAKLTTLINNTVRYETEVAFTKTGTEVISKTLSNGSNSPVTLIQPGVGSDTGVTLSGSAGGGTLDLSGLSSFSGIVVDGPGGIGSTAALHSITRQAIISTLATTASGQSVQNNVDISVGISNIDALKAAKLQTRILNSLQGVIR